MDSGETIKDWRLQGPSRGYLRTLKAQLNEALSVSSPIGSSGRGLGDFLALARETLDAGEKDVAAVLAFSFGRCAKTIWDRSRS